MHKLTPSFDDFSRASQEASIVPVWAEVVADGLTPVAAASLYADQPGCYLLESIVGGDQWARYSFVGFDPEYAVRGGKDSFEVLHGGEVTRRSNPSDPWKELAELVDSWSVPDVSSEFTQGLPRFWGGAVGYVSYDSVRSFEPTVAAPLDPEGKNYEFYFSIGGPVLIFDNLRQTLRVVIPVNVGGSSSDLRKLYKDGGERVAQILDELRERRVSLRPLSPPARRGEAKPSDLSSCPPTSGMTPEQFGDAVRKAQAYIRAGDIFQVVLSQRFRIPKDGVDSFDLYRAMRVVNPSPYMYFLRLDDLSIAGASPETLVRLENGTIHVRPLAGTRPRGANEAEDRKLEQELLEDPKEIAEHVMLVDLGRNDVGRVSKAGSVKLSDTMTIEHYSHVMHIVSNVSGTVKDETGPIDVIKAAFPAGTLSGAPKVRAMQIIDELENEPRGVYAGAVGYIGFDGNVDLAIAIRTVVETQNELWLQAGAGIVEGSVPQKEYEESVNKARAALVAVDMVRSSSDPN